MEKKQHENNTYAKNVKGGIIHISEVDSGRKGYFCIGCGVQMEGRKGQIRKHYFAHIPKVKGEVRNCAYSDETYRHKLAKEILLRLKAVKVPALYKYPDDLNEGIPNQLANPRIIIADKAIKEVAIFENKKGELIVNQTKGDSKKKHLWVKPDIVFFNKASKPILLVEVVATHKVDSEKLAKLKRLGIDTISISIPKASPEEIESTFYKTARTKWIYSNEREKASYIPTTSRNSEGIPPIDEFQKKLLRAQKSFSCRSSEIGNLIRSIEKCLESEYYRSIEQHLRSEIARTEENTEQHRKRLSSLQDEHRERITRRFELAERELEVSENEFREIKNKFEQESKDLEERYTRKRDELEKASKEYKSTESTEIEGLEGRIEELRNKLAGCSTRKSSIRGFIGKEDIKIDRIGERITSCKEDFRRFQEEKSKRVEEHRTKLRERNERVLAESRANFNDRKRELREEFNNLRSETISGYNEKDYTKSTRYRRRIKKLVEAGEHYLVISEGKSRINRDRTAKKLLDEKVYLNWY